MSLWKDISYRKKASYIVIFIWESHYIELQVFEHKSSTFTALSPIITETGVCSLMFLVVLKQCNNFYLHIKCNKHSSAQHSIQLCCILHRIHQLHNTYQITYLHAGNRPHNIYLKSDRLQRYHRIMDLNMYRNG